MKNFWNCLAILFLLIIVVTFSRESRAYDFKHIDTDAHPEHAQLVQALSEQMSFNDTNLSPPALQKAKRELASCEIDMMAQDQEEYGLNQQDMTSMFHGVAKYYHYHNTPFFSTVNQENIEYAYELEHRCAEYHPQKQERINPRMAMYEAEKMVENQCNWDSVSTPDEYEAARECRIKIHKEIYNKYGLDY